MKLHEYITEIFEQTGLNQPQLAKVLDVTDPHISRLQRGDALPSIELLKKIHKEFPRFVDFDRFLYLYGKAKVPELTELLDKKFNSSSSSSKTKLSLLEKKLLEKFASSPENIKVAICALLGFAYDESEDRKLTQRESKYIDT